MFYPFIFLTTPKYVSDFNTGKGTDKKEVLLVKLAISVIEKSTIQL